MAISVKDLGRILVQDDVDNALSSTSINPVQNKVIKAALDNKVSDAPNNDKQYVRKNGEWSEVEIGKSSDDYSHVMLSEADMANLTASAAEENIIYISLEGYNGTPSVTTSSTFGSSFGFTFGSGGSSSQSVSSNVFGSSFGFTFNN